MLCWCLYTYSTGIRIVQKKITCEGDNDTKGEERPLIRYNSGEYLHCMNCMDHNTNACNCTVTFQDLGP